MQLNCPYCNENMGPNVTGNFCQKCGHKLIRCASCGEILYQKIKFCPNDGTPVPAEAYNELPDGLRKAGAGNAAVKQTTGKPADKTPGHARQSSGPAPKRSENQGFSKNRQTSDSASQGPSRNRQTSGPVPVRPVGGVPSGNAPQKNGPKKGLLAGLIVLLLVALGTGGYLIADKVMSGSSKNSQSESADNDRKKDRQDDKEISDEENSDEENSDEEDSDKKNSDENDSNKEDTSGVSFKPEKTDSSKIKASVSLADPSIYSGMKKAAISSSSASSVVLDNSAGIKNEAAQMVDGNEITSWQEGVSGDGIGEWVQFVLKKEYNVRYLTFKMGNWRDQDRYNMNNRPKGILLRMGGQEYKLTFPDGKNEYMVELSDSLPISDLYLEITSVYKGSSWDDTCISEMTIYAE